MTLPSTERFRSSALLSQAFGCLIAGLACTVPAGAQSDPPAAGGPYAILIVGDEANAEVLRREKVLIQEIARSMKRANRLPIYSYHFNKDRERIYCEKKLGVLREDLLFIGVVALKDRVPRKIVYRLDRIVTPARAAADITARCDELTGGEAAASATPSPATPATPDPAAAATRFRVQLGVFSQAKTAQDLTDQLKAKGYDAHWDKGSAEGRDSFKVWVGSYASREEAQSVSGRLQNDGFDKGLVLESR